MYTNRTNAIKEIPVCPICNHNMSLDKVKNCKKIGNYSEWICEYCQEGHEDGSRYGIEMQVIHNTGKIKFDCACEFEPNYLNKNMNS